jgi:hypothetical protein
VSRRLSGNNLHFYLNRRPNEDAVKVRAGDGLCRQAAFAGVDDLEHCRQILIHNAASTWLPQR